MDNTQMSEKELTVEDLDESAQQTEEQINMMAWKVEEGGGEIVESTEQDICVRNLLRSVSENICRSFRKIKYSPMHVISFPQEMSFKSFKRQVRSDYQQLRRELVEVQALQRELSLRLRDQLRLVHGKFARLRQRLEAHSAENR